MTPWFIAVQIATGGDFLREAMMGDLAPKMVSGHEGHGAPPGLHLLLLSLLIFPAIAFLPAGLAAAVHALRSSPASESARAARILIALITPGWLVFEFAPTKLVHYTLPLYAALAVLAGWGAHALTGARPVWLWLGAALGVLAALLAGLVALVLAVIGDGSLALAAGCAALVALLAVASGSMILRRSMLAALALALSASLTWHAGVRGLVAPSLERVFLADQVGGLLEGAEIDPRLTPVLSTFTEPSLAFELGGAVRLIAPDEVEDALAELDGPGVLILDTVRFARAGAEDARPAPPSPARLEAFGARSLGEASGMNYSRGEETTLLVLYLDGAPAAPGDAP